MASPLPTTSEAIARVTWAELEPCYAALEAQTLNPNNADAWLREWTAVAEVANEAFSRLNVATTVNTADQEAETRLNHYLDETFPQVEAAEQRLKEKLLAAGLEPAGFDVPLRNMRAEAELYREANVPLKSAETKLGMEYDKLIGAQTVVWDGEERTMPWMGTLLTNPDRGVRESAWRAAMARRLLDRGAIDDLWGRFLDLRLGIAANADLGDDYRAYQWRAMQRFDYSPDDAKRFQDSIEEVVVPAAARVYRRRADAMGLSALRPWDLDVDPLGRPPLRPFANNDDLNEKSQAVFDRVDPALGAHFRTMRAEGLLDLESRKNKAPGGYCTDFAVHRRPFIFMNAVGLHDDVQTLLHEGGHAFHVFESAHLPYRSQMNVPTEFAEVASMSMELLGGPYLAGTFYSEAEAARARTEHFESGLLFWPYMAVVDAFQHWVYENPTEGRDSRACDATWSRLWDRFMPGVDWTGLEAEKQTGWHRKLHIHQIPFYYIEYGLAQLGAYQVFANARRDRTEAVNRYRSGLALGGTATLPDLFAAAGARFSLDADTLRVAVGLIEETLGELEAQSTT
ncbi:MAG: M3 family oligoendopeptidase [Fimbriimonadaceae bacterium]|nr:M3 family oligoendopeptidase [Fimbriimonadaceae bacterium]